jgi:ribonuclease BN (tRNA processing enzyme)
MTEAFRPVRDTASATVRVTVLGSGDAFGSGGRAHSAHLVEAPGVTFLVDCGPTVLQALKRLGRDPAAIDFVLVSHLHGDHFGGIPFLFLEYRYETGRSRPLTIGGPAGTAARVTALFAALYETTAREPLPFAVRHVTMAPDEPQVVGGVRLLPFATPHANEMVCLGYRLEVAGRTILYSGDSAWTDRFLELSRGADLFLCECSTYETRLPIHLAYPEIAARASALGCRRLVLTHLGREPLARLGELSLETARDGMTIEL